MAGLQAYKYEDRFVINPGSATGAYSTVTQQPTPSFVLMDIDGIKASQPGTKVFRVFRWYSTWFGQLG